MTEPIWNRNLSILQNKIKTILVSHKVSTDYSVIDILTDMPVIEEYWVKCFTHSSIDPVNNYEMFEYIGDKSLSYNFVKYAYGRFGSRLNEKNGTLLTITYMSKLYQSGLSAKMGLPELLRYDPEVPDASIHMKEDLFEAFAGCLDIVGDNKLQLGVGSLLVYNLLLSLFKDTRIDIDDIKKDPRTILKEIYDKMGWGELKYRVTESDKPELGPYKVAIVNISGEVYGEAYGSEKHAYNEASIRALEYLESQGITWDSADKYKLRKAGARNEDLKRQMDRADIAFGIMNERMQKEKGYSLTSYSVSQADSAKAADGSIRYTMAVSVGFKIGDSVSWRTVASAVGVDETDARTKALKSFADKFGVNA